MESLHSLLIIALSGYRHHSSHIHPKTSCLCLTPLPPPHFYMLTPNHPHSYTPDAQTISICSAMSRHIKHTLNTQKTTNLTSFSILQFNDTTHPSHHNMLRPLQTIIDFQPSLPLVSVLYVSALWTARVRTLPTFGNPTWDLPNSVQQSINSLQLGPYLLFNPDCDPCSGHKLCISLPLNEMIAPWSLGSQDW